MLSEKFSMFVDSFKIVAITIMHSTEIIANR